MAKPKCVVTAEFSHQELCYLDGSLRDQIREYEFTIFKYGPEHGNYAYLLKFSQRLAKKLSRLQSESLKSARVTKEGR